MGTRFIATQECDVSTAYKEAIMASGEDDIVLSQNLTGVNVSIIKPQSFNEFSIKPNAFIQWALKNKILKRFMRMFLVLKSIRYLKKTRSSEDNRVVWQAGKSVAGIHEIKSVSEVFKAFS